MGLDVSSNVVYGVSFKGEDEIRKVIKTFLESLPKKYQENIVFDDETELWEFMENYYNNLPPVYSNLSFDEYYDENLSESFLIVYQTTSHVSPQDKYDSLPPTKLEIVDTLSIDSFVEALNIVQPTWLYYIYVS